MNSKDTQEIKKLDSGAYAKSMTKFVAILILFCWTSLGAVEASCAAGIEAKRAALTAEDLTDILRQPNIGAKATNVQVVGVGPDVTVPAQSAGASSERDLKIDAVFLAKALFQAAGTQIGKAKVLFSQAGHDGRYITITSKQMGDNGAGMYTA